MKVASRRGDRAWAEGGLYQVDRGTALQAMACVHVPQPVRRDERWQARTLRRGFHNLMGVARVEGLALV